MKYPNPMNNPMSLKGPGKLAALAIGIATATLSLWAAESPTLPWQREVSLWEAAQTTAVEGTLNPTDPGRGAAALNNLKMHTVMWGPPNRITISINKNNVWDRRLHDFKPPTLQDIIDGAFSPANKDYVGVKIADTWTFVPVDFSDLPGLARKLARKSDPVSAMLADKLDATTKAALDSYEKSKTHEAESVAGNQSRGVH